MAGFSALSSLDDAARRRVRAWLRGAAVAALLGVHFFVALQGKLDWSTTSDEVAHMVSGLTYLQKGDFRLQPENGNLPQRWVAIPAWLRGARLPDREDPYWMTSDVWMLGYAYFYQTGNNLEQLLLEARAMNLVWSLACGLLIFCWSRRFFGDAGGFVSLGFWCLDPNFLAHGALATSDMCMTFFMLAAVGAWWRFLASPGWRSGALSAAVFAIACVAKFSAVLLLPMFLLLVAVRRWRAPLGGRRGTLALALAGHAAAAVLVIWASFDFRYAAANPTMPAMAHFIIPWDDIIRDIGWQGRVLAWLRAWHALPEAFLFGYNHVLAFAGQRACYLDGEHGIYGWVRFFPLAFLYKTPLPEILAIIGTGLIALRRWWRRPDRQRRDLQRVAPLLVLIAVYGVFSLATHLNIGHRHILPIYPALFIFMGALGAWARRRPRLGGSVLALLFGWSIAEVAAIHPHELAYFNQIAGGPENGWRHLADSSLDWGQDLPGLADWLHAHNSGPHREDVYLSYFGNGQPSHYGIHAIHLPFVDGLHRRAHWYRPGPGLYCLSVTNLLNIYLRVPTDWSDEHERDYQKLRALDSAFHDVLAGTPEQQAPLLAMHPIEAWEQTWKEYDDLRLMRLCILLRAKPPLATIGHSIFVYRLTQEDLDNALSRRFSDLGAAVEQLEIDDGD